MRVYLLTSNLFSDLEQPTTRYSYIRSTSYPSLACTQKSEEKLADQPPARKRGNPKRFPLVPDSETSQFEIVPERYEDFISKKSFANYERTDRACKMELNYPVLRI